MAVARHGSGLDQPYADPWAGLGPPSAPQPLTMRAPVCKVCRRGEGAHTRFKAAEQLQHLPMHCFGNQGPDVQVKGPGLLPLSSSTKR